ncbi:Hypothetical predicted protein [Octopus vulgaris]|uniref:Uncharacterized protein n=1 Tax=Octopus vulgaris TaxID=6645 RepID=A0AA36ALS3_OCTVU|nr:Hypothetical predicted protein [Octopus vulgaris]
MFIKAILLNNITKMVCDVQQGKGSKRKGGKFKRSDGSFSDSSNSFIRQAVSVVLIDFDIALDV